jgi:hypothetical protein
MNPLKRRATALTSDQIAYVRGCQRLQLAVFNLTHKDPLKALSNKFAMAALKDAILILMEARKKVRLLTLKNYLKKMAKICPEFNSFFGKKNSLTPSTHFPH